MKTRDLIQAIFDAAGRNDIAKAELYRRAGLLQPSVSRAMSSGDCKFSTINRLLEAGGFKLVVVKDEANAEKLKRGELF